MTTFFKRPGVWTLLAGMLMAGALIAMALAPTEQTMGDAQRVMYIHIPVAWLALVGFLVMAVGGLGYLVRRDLSWDRWSQSVCELGWLCATLTLVTGSLWARSAWGTWWTWDPRLVTSFILWALYSANLILRGSIDDAHRRARFASVLTIIGVADVPLVVMATRWFRGVHPVSPQMEPAMRMVLLASVIGFSAIVSLLVVRRRIQLQQEHLVEQLEAGTGIHGSHLPA